MALKNGMLDMLDIQYCLQNGLRVKGERLVPVAYILSADEPDFGCEGRLDGKPSYATIHALTLKGQKAWNLSEEDLMESGIYDRMWICRRESTKELVRWREGSDAPEPLSEEIWGHKLEVKQ